MGPRMVVYCSVAYRDDRQALALQVAELERVNEELQEELTELRERSRHDREEKRDQRRRESRHGCVMCGGTLHAVAVFSGRHDAPKSLQLSTTRFAAQGGGFSSSTPIRAMVCSSCGFVHHYIDLERPDAALVTGHGDEAIEDESSGS